MNRISNEPQTLHANVRSLRSSASSHRLTPRGALGLFFLAVFLRTGAVNAGPVVINEIHFHPSSHQVFDEYIELHNTDTNTVDLQGWRLDRGVSFTFTNSTPLAPGGFLVVAANLESFAQNHPAVTAVLGGWTGSLANSGETLRLVDAQDVTSDEVRYADSGDFATRHETFSSSARGWSYQSTADGSGPSLERIDPTQSGMIGANWEASVAFQGSPGGPNSRLLNNPAPLIWDLEHAPSIPRSNEPVTITVRVGGPSNSPPAVVLFYRIASIAKPAEFSQVSMLDDGTQNDGLAGDGRFGVILAELPHRTVVEFYVQATSDTGPARTYPPPSRDRFGIEAQYANALYQVDNSSYSGPQPVYSLVLTETDRASLASLPQSDPYSDVELNATFISNEAGRSEVRYGCSVRLRGASSRFLNPPNYRVNIPSDRRWNGVTALNLNIFSVHSQIAGEALAKRAGLVTEDHRPVQVRVNGVNLATTGQPPLGVYAHTEVPDSAFAENHFPEDSDGNLYRASSHAATLEYLGTDPVRYRSAGYSKTTHQSENDWTDLISLTEALANPNTNSYLTSIEARVNIQQWLTYFSVFLLSGSTETSLGTGIGDDYAMYRGVKDPRFQLIGHDWDSVLGEAGSAPAQIFVTSELPAVDRLLKHPEVAPLYYGELLRQLQGAFSPQSVARVLDENLSSWVSATTLFNMKRYATNRASTILGLIPTELKWRGGTASTITGPLVRFATNNVLMWGTTHAEITRRVLVNGNPALLTPWVARWTNRVALNYGLNQVLIQSLDAQGWEFERTNIVAWTPAPAHTPLSGSVAGTRTLTLAESPYRVTNDWTVPRGTRLRIEPGVSVIFNPGTRLLVEGEFEAVGTETQPIFLSKDPADPSLSVWQGIVFNRADGPVRLSHVYLIGAGSSGTGIRALQSRLEIDHLTVLSTENTCLDLQDCSLRLSDSRFPPEVINEVIRGKGIPADGSMIIARNHFAGLNGTNDVIRFTGGHRPGPILQLLDNDFLGGSDDLIELTDADAHIEGNLFAHAESHETAPPGDSASAITVIGNNGASPTTEVMLARNSFLLSDHGVVVRNGARVTAENNTFHLIGGAAFRFDEPGLRASGATPGWGARLTGNLIWGAATNFLDRYEAHPQFGTTELTANFNLLSGEDLPANSSSILREDPRLTDSRRDLTSASALRLSVALQPGSPALGAGADGRDLGALVSAGLALRGHPLGNTTSTRADLQVSGAGYVAYRFALDDGPLSEPRALHVPLTLTGLAPGTHRVRVLGLNSAGTWDETIVESAPWQVDPNAPRIVLSELLARNRAAYVHEERFPDAIELQNLGTTHYDLGGMGITDDPSQPHRFQIPTGTVLPPGGYLVLFAENERRSPLHLGFQLGAEGGSLMLFAPGATNLPPLDTVDYGPQLSDFSIARLPDGSWDLALPTLGSPNRTARTGDPRRLVINEWQANGTGDDFVELYNLDPLPVRLGGLTLTDDTIAYPNRHRIAPLSFIDGNGLQVFVADGNEAAGPNHLRFGLSSDSGLLSLHTQTGATIDCFLYQSQRREISQGRSPNGASLLAYFTEPTPGSPNPAPAPPFAREIQNYTTNIISFTNHVWKYRQDNVNLLTAWRQPDYDDADWMSGVGPFGLEDCNCLPEPIRTPLVLLQPDGQAKVRTYYFRTSFELPPFYSSNSSFVANLFYDDGVVVYFNGRQGPRQGVPTLFNHNTFASTSISPEGRLQSIPIPATNFVPGINFLAIEVHQSDASSDDIALGFSLRADRAVTNFTSTQKVLLNEILARNQGLTNADGTVTDWVELYNPSVAQATDLSGMSLTDSADQPRRWVFPPGSSLPPGGYRVVRLSSDLPASLEASEALNAGFSLKAEGDRLLLFDSPAAGSGLLDGLSFGIQAVDYSLGRYSTAGPFWELNIPTPGAPNLATPLESESILRINEWMAAPTSGDDWFELFNPGLLPVALAGLHLSDSPSQPTQHQIPPLSFLGTGPRGAYLQWRADGAPEKGADHVNFKLAATGETIGLFGRDGATILDLVNFGKQDTGISEGRLPDGGATWVRFPRTASPGQLNHIPFGDVVINEVIARRASGGAIELSNASESPQHIGGWWLSTDERNPKQARIPDHTILPPGGILVLDAAQLALPSGGGIGLILEPGQTQTVYLSGVTTGGALSGLRTHARAATSDVDVSTGPFETSLGLDYPHLSSVTLGAANTSPRVGPVVINEIHYHPKAVEGETEADEFIELLNTSGSPVSLFSSSEPTNTWHLRNAVEFDLVPGTTLAANGFLLLVGFDPATNASLTASFRSRFGVPATVAIQGPWSGRLDNSGETVELNQPTTPLGTRLPRSLADRIAYTDIAPWATAADGQGSGLGNSLQRRSSASYGNEATNWVASPPTAGRLNGTPASLPPAVTRQPTDQLATPGQTVSFSATVSGTGPLVYQWRLNGLELPGATNNTLTLSAASASDEGTYDLRVSNASGAARSATARLRLNRPPNITRQPEGSVLLLGSDFTLSVGVQGPGPLSIQWKHNGTSLLGGTNPVLTLRQVTPAQLGTYVVEVSNRYGRVTSDAALVEIETPPSFVQQPSPALVLVNEGQPATLTSTVAGSTPLRFQWRRNGQPVRNATNQTLVISNPRLDDSGIYTLSAANPAGSALSAGARISVRSAPVLTLSGPTEILREGNSTRATFWIQRFGTNDLPFDVHLGWTGTATAGEDYAVPPSSIRLPAGTDSLEVSIRVLDDSQREPLESVQLGLISTPDYKLATNRTATAFIDDDENQPPVLLVLHPTGELHYPRSPTNIVIEIQAADPDAGDGVTNVILVANQNLLLGQWSSPPYVATWTNPPAGSNTVTAYAVDQLGAYTISNLLSLYLNQAPQVQVLQPSEGDFFSEGTPSISVTASAADLDGQVASVMFYLGTNLIAQTTNAPYSTQLTDLPVGHHVLRVLATDYEGQPSITTERRFSVGLRPEALTDAFRSRGLINGTNRSLSADNRGATTEPGEPTPVYDGGVGRSLWIEWIAPTDGICVLDTLGSRGPVGESVDAILAVYLGQQLNTLWEYVSDDDAASSGPNESGASRVSFACEAGVSYQIRISAYSTGTVRLNLAVVPEALLELSGDAVEAPEFPWRTRKLSPWAAQAAITSDGSDALRIPQPTDNSATWVETTVEGPALVSFQWRMRGMNSSFGSTVLRDRLVARISGIQVLEQTRQGTWTPGIITVPPGSQTVRWSFLTPLPFGDTSNREAFLDQVKVLRTRVSSVQLSSPHVVEVQLQGSGGTPYTLEASEDLVNWTVVGNGRFDSNGSSLLSVTNLIEGLPKQFLRSRQVP
jgi:hypothetical protein